MRPARIRVWIKPEAVDRRQGLVGKRFQETSAPFVLSIHQGRIVFEAADASGKWTYNVRSPEVLKPDQWQHLGAVIEEDQGVRLYLDGKEVLHSPARGKLSRQRRAAGDRPRGLGRCAGGRAAGAGLLSWPYGLHQIGTSALVRRDRRRVCNREELKPRTVNHPKKETGNET